MEYKDFKKAILIGFVAVGIIVLWAYIVEDRPECVIEGCHHKQMPHSMVCFSHREMETQPSTSNVRPSGVKKQIAPGSIKKNILAAVRKALVKRIRREARLTVVPEWDLPERNKVREAIHMKPMTADMTMFF